MGQSGEERLSNYLGMSAVNNTDRQSIRNIKVYTINSKVRNIG